MAPSSRRSLWRPLLVALAAVLAAAVVLRIVPRDSLPFLRQPRQLVLVSLDTVGSRHLAFHPSAPHLASLAATGVSADNAFSPVGWTLPAHMSVWTGLQPARHGVVREDLALAAEVATLPELLATQGFRTAAFTGGAYVAGHFGFARGFESYVETDRGPGRCSDFGAYRDALAAWVKEHAHDDFFLFVHTYDAHPPYPCDAAESGASASSAALSPERRKELRGEERRQRESSSYGEGEIAYLRELYDRGVKQSDGDLGELLAILSANGVREQALVAVLSDHGEAFGEHAVMGHAWGAHAEVVHVPLVLAGPGLPRGAKVRTPIALPDLFPTLLAAFGVAVPPGSPLDGENLWPLLAGQAAERPERLVYSTSADLRLSSARSAAWSLVIDRGPHTLALYDRLRDPWEQRNLAATVASDHLLQRLRAHEQALAAGPPARPVTRGAPSAEELERLRALGYLH